MRNRHTPLESTLDILGHEVKRGDFIAKAVRAGNLAALVIYRVKDIYELTSDYSRGETKLQVEFYPELDGGTTTINHLNLLKIGAPDELV